MKLNEVIWKGQNVGVTGSENGPTANQKSLFTRIVRAWARKGTPTTFHSGDCIGVDDYARYLVFHHWTPNVILVGHPPDNDKKRAFGWFDVARPVKPYLKRDDELVKEIHILIVMAREYDEIRQSGTWSTVRYARKRHKLIVFIRPDGSIKIEDHRKEGPLFHE